MKQKQKSKYDQMVSQYFAEAKNQMGKISFQPMLVATGRKILQLPKEELPAVLHATASYTRRFVYTKLLESEAIESHDWGLSQMLGALLGAILKQNPACTEKDIHMILEHVAIQSRTMYGIPVLPALVAVGRYLQDHPLSEKLAVDLENVRLRITENLNIETTLPRKGDRVAFAIIDAIGAKEIRQLLSHRQKQRSRNRT